MLQIEIGKEIIWLEEVNSTNAYAVSMAKSGAADGLVVAARFQTEGKGQRGNTWESRKDENLTFSIILFPSFIEVQKQFLLSKVASLAVFDTLCKMVSDVSIKWPNDIYIGNNKVAGILIENSFSSKMMGTSVIGIGLNVNQKIFSDDLPNPTSLIIETGKSHDIVTLLNSLCKSFSFRYKQLIEKEWDKISTDYYKSLYRNQDYYNYSAKGRVFTARVVDVKESGELVLETTRGEILEFGFKEVSFAGD